MFNNKEWDTTRKVDWILHQSKEIVEAFEKARKPNGINAARVKRNENWILPQPE